MYHIHSKSNLQLYFCFRYKLRKHTTAVHPNQPLRYTNLLTGETCVGEDIEYGDAIVERIPRPKNNSSMTSPSTSSGEGTSRRSVTTRSSVDANFDFFQL